ncbi:hypothetical protein KCU95_g7058, partial [Aureobasidium melanogenum]
MDPKSRLTTTTTHGYPLSSYCVGLRKTLNTVPEGNVRNVSRNCYDWIRSDGPDTPLENIFAGLRLDDIFTLTLEDFYAHQTSTQPKFLNKLPPEIICRILSFMDPEDYVGFADISPRALELSNNHVVSEFPGLLTKRYWSNDDIPKGLKSYLEQNPGLKNYASVPKFIRRSEEEMETPCMGGLLDDYDPDVDFDSLPLMPTQPNLFTKLPPEIIYRILSFMSAEDYVGFADTCRLALELSNNQVEFEAMVHDKTCNDESPPVESTWWPDLKSRALAVKYLNHIKRKMDEDLWTPCMGGFVGHEEDE